jgi:hypothetical protein
MNHLPIILLSLSISTGGIQKDSARDHHTSFVKAEHHKMTIAEVLKKYTDAWMKIPGVIGTGEGKTGDKPCINVFVERNSPAVKKKFPKTAGGYKVILVETGKVGAH